jgi:hypothetical protein
MDYVSLAKALADARVAPSQLYGEHIRVAKKTNRLREAARDSLVRFLVGHLKKGWGKGRHFEFRLASAVAAWKTSILQFGINTSSMATLLDAVVDALEKAAPPQGWIPKSPADPLVQDAFENGWPVHGPN